MGYVYVLSWSERDDLIKIGRTSKKPKERAIQLSRPTGVVGNYTVEWFIETPDDAILEKLFHSISLPNGTIFD